MQEAFLQMILDHNMVSGHASGLAKQDDRILGVMEHIHEGDHINTIVVER